MNILEEIADYLDEVTFYGSYLAALCPFHPDTRPSFIVHKDTYSCKSCGKWGRTEQLLQELSGKNVIIRIPKRYDSKNPWSRWLRKESLKQVLKTAWEVRKKNPSLGSYLSNRGIPVEVQNKLGIGYRDDWYTIPIWDANKDLIGATARKGEGNESKAKYINPHQQDSNLLYTPSWNLVSKNKIIFLTFGIFDSVSISITGRASCSTTAGKNLEPSALDKIRKRIIIIPDAGEEIEARKLASRLGWRGKVLELDYPYGTKDVNDLFNANRKLLEEKLNEVV